jgi:uncharacterized membrane protein
VESPSALAPHWPIRTALWFAIAIATSFLLFIMHSPLAPLPGVVTLLLVPGATVMSALHTRPANTAGRIVLAVSLSLMVIMVFGGVASLLGPHIGLAHPLDPFPQRIIWAVLGVIVLAIGVVGRIDPATWIFEGVNNAHIAGIIASGLLVVLSILGVARLNYSGNNRIAIFSAILDVVVLLAGVVGGWRRTSRWPLGTLLYAATLALLLSTSLRGGHLYGWDIQQEFGVASHTLRSGLWVIPANHDPYASMLSLTVLPTILHSLLKLRLIAFFELVVPAILALLPLAVFSTVSRTPRWAAGNRPIPRPGLALGVVTALIVSSQVFPGELVSISRQAMALTMLAAIVMVLSDSTMPARRAQVVIGLLIVAISFTHYSTSYLLAGILLIAWLVGSLWSRGWLGTPRTLIHDYRSHARSRKIVNGALVALALVAAIGWNLGATRNNALSAPYEGLVASGLRLTTSSGPSSITAPELERMLVSEYHITNKWIVPVPDASSVHLVSATAPSSPGVAPSLAKWWNPLNFLAHESLWVLSGFALLYGLFVLGRRQFRRFSSDLVGLAVAGLFVGAALRFSSTFANFYNPERGAIVAAILLVTPITMLLDDLATRFARVLLVIGVISVGLLTVSVTGLSDLFFGGGAPGSLVARGDNVEQFTVSTPELATAVWLRETLNSSDEVQSDRYGQLVLLSEIGNYRYLPEIVPPEVDHHSYIYLSTANLIDGRSRAAVDGDRYIGVYRSNITFFDRNFYIVYSTGVTRVYH